MGPKEHQFLPPSPLTISHNMHLLKLEPPPEEAKDPFRTTPWAMTLFSDPALQAITNTSRLTKPTTNSDTFLSTTLATPDTISAAQSFWKSPDPTNEFGEIVNLLAIGSGVNGHIDICHGGFVSVLLDEALGFSAENEAAEFGKAADMTTMTVYLKIVYKRPIKTPNVILSRAAVSKREGRKLYVSGSVEDGLGGVLASAEALFLVMEKTKVLALL